MKKLIFTLLFCMTFAGSYAQLPSFSIGQQAPNFTATDYHGNVHDLYTYCSEGKYVMVDFFAYWCGPCLATAPKIDEFYHKYGCNQGNVIVLGNESDPQGTLQLLIDFILNSGGDTANTYPQWAGSLGGSVIGDIYDPYAYPTICLIGPDSTFIQTDIWPISNVGSIEAFFPTGVLTPMSCYANIVDIADASTGKLYPNPASSAFYLEVDLKKDGNVILELSDMMGRIVLSKSYFLHSGGQQIRLDVGDLPMGTYVVKGYFNHELMMSNKLSIQN
ncbi:MAG: redoxin domain-containing protein [Bacteroidales bacterium]